MFTYATSLLFALLGHLAVLCAALEGLLRPYLVNYFPPSIVVFIYSSTRSIYLKLLGSYPGGPHPADHHPVKLFGLHFRNDLGNAAGLDKDGSLLEFVSCGVMGFYIL